MRLFLLAVGTIVLLAAFGLWVTETPGGPETEVASFYVLALLIGIVVAVVGGIAFMFTRRDRYGARGAGRSRR